jgi:hypothetical protein
MNHQFMRKGGFQMELLKEKLGNISLGKVLDVGTGDGSFINILIIIFTVEKTLQHFITAVLFLAKILGLEPPKSALILPFPIPLWEF